MIYDSDFGENLSLHNKQTPEEVIMLDEDFVSESSMDVAVEDNIAEDFVSRKIDVAVG